MILSLSSIVSSFVGAFSFSATSIFLVSSLSPDKFFETSVYKVPITEAYNLGKFKSHREYLESKPEDYPRGSQDQDIFRYIESKFYPRMKVDYQNLMAYRS